MKNGLDILVHQTMERWRVPGLALAIVQGNEVLHLAGYGLRDIAGGLPVTPETLFPIASCTKAFTVMALGLLVDDGKLEWDKPVKEYLSDWQMYDPIASKTLTVRDMLSHRSDFGKVQPGDVIAIPYSDVAWTPLFARAGAVVAEAGGILSHSSIVAREYGIPCVVTVNGACSLLEHVEVIVDGYQGAVQVVK